MPLVRKLSSSTESDAVFEKHSARGRYRHFTTSADNIPRSRLVERRTDIKSKVKVTKMAGGIPNGAKMDCGNQRGRPEGGAESSKPFRAGKQTVLPALELNQMWKSSLSGSRPDHILVYSRSFSNRVSAAGPTKAAIACVEGFLWTPALTSTSSMTMIWRTRYIVHFKNIPQKSMT